MRKLIPLLVLAACSHEPEVRKDTIPPNAWMMVSLDVVGPESDNDKYQRCVEAAGELGIGVVAQGQVKVVLNLDDHGNRISVLNPAGQVLRAEDRPGWPMAMLCVDAFSMAQDLLRLAPVVGKAEPGPECVMKGGVDGGGYMPSYDGALNLIKLRAAKAGMNYVSLDAMRGYTNSSLVSLTGRGFVCQGAPPEEAPQASACVPDCSPGYLCVQGRCVSACNPPCAAGQRCGADRICH